MSTKEEAAAVVASIRLIEVEEQVSASDPERLSPSTTTTVMDGSGVGVKERLLSGYTNAHLRATTSDLRQAQVDDTRDDDVNKEGDDGDETVDTEDVTEADTFDIEVIEEYSINDAAPPGAGVTELERDSQEKDDAWCSPSEETCSLRHPAVISFLCPKNQSENQLLYTKIPIESPDYNSMERCPTSSDAPLHQEDETTKPEKRNSILQNIVEDFTPSGDQKILRAIGRTAAVNAAVLVTAATGGAAGAVGFVTGGAITSKRLFEGLAKQDEKEVTKSLAVYGCATAASIAGQAVTGALMIGVAGASLPLAGAVAFGVGCCSGITAGALSEWTVDSVMDKVKEIRIGRWR